MPQTRKKSSKELAISLTEKQTFNPGDTIIGTITRWSQIVDPGSILTIQFRGRSKCKITRGSGNNRHVYKARLDYWLRDPIKQELYRGPIHIPPHTEEPLTWPFALTIPTQVSRALFMQIDNDAHFLNKDDPQAYELPATFASGIGESDEFFIEYNLLAILRDSHGHSEEAVLPVTIRRSSTATPINDFGLKVFPFPSVRTIDTYRLDPELVSAELTFKQKAKELFGSSKVPNLTFKLHIMYPTLLQIGHPEAAPFQIRASMIENRTSDLVKNTNPALIVTRFKVKLDEITNGIVARTFSATEDSSKQKWTLLDWTGRAPALQSLSRTPSRQPSPVPSSHRARTEEVEGSQTGPSTKTTKEAPTSGKDSLAPPEYQKYDESGPEPPPPDAETLIVPWESAMLPLDLGQVLGLRVPLRKRFESRDIQASFQSVAIKSHHNLRWEIELHVAGEDCEFSGETKVEILGPSDDDYAINQ